MSQQDFQTIRDALLDASLHIADAFRTGSYTSRRKADTSIQTSVDVDIERRLASAIHRAFPTDTIKGEEGGIVYGGAATRVWNIDPLDGTDNFFAGLPYFSSTLDLIQDDNVVFGLVANPITRELFEYSNEYGARVHDAPLFSSGVTDLKKARVCFIPDFKTKREPAVLRCRQQLQLASHRVLDTWAPALDWCYLAKGTVDAIVVAAAIPFGVTLGLELAKRSGCVISDWNGAAPTPPCRFIVAASTPALHHALIELLKVS